MGRSERTNVALEKLHNEVAAIITGDVWRSALALRSKLHKYSFNNLLLVWMQRPDATMLAGYRKWEELGRNVRKGEKGIAILAPLMVAERDPDTGDKTGRQKLVGYKTVYVFDVSQTDGDALPVLPRPALLTGDEAGSRIIADRLVALARSEGFPVSFRPVGELNGAKGYFTPTNKSIVIGSDLTPKETAAVLAHELGHAMLGHVQGKDYDYALGELEAETAAYLVMDAVGLPTNESAFVYLAHYTRTPENMAKLLQAGTRASRVADKMLAALEVEDDVAVAA